MLHEPLRAVGRQSTLLHAVQHGGVSCEWLLRELLNENANMGVQSNYFVRKRPFSMGWIGGFDWKNSIKKITGPCEKKQRLFHTLGGRGGCLMPYSYCAVRLCLLRPLRMRVWAKFARTSRIWPNVGVRACTSSP